VPKSHWIFFCLPIPTRKHFNTPGTNPPYTISINFWVCGKQQQSKDNSLEEGPLHVNSIKRVHSDVNWTITIFQAGSISIAPYWAPNVLSENQTTCWLLCPHFLSLMWPHNYFTESQPRMVIHDYNLSHTFHYGT
jgi:hypothetical protein